MEDKIVSNQALFQNIAILIEQARQRVVAAVNLTMVHTYFEISGRIKLFILSRRCLKHYK